MKNKTKLVLGLAALTAVTAGVATTSTLAWFTTTRTASVSFQEIGIYGATGDLGISLLKAGTYGYKGSEGGSGNNLTVTSTTNSITDISGNGAQFYKPTWDPLSSSIATSIVSVTNGSNTAHDNYYYVQFFLVLSNSSTANAMNVYLSKGTAITSSDTNNLNAAHAARVAIFNYNTTEKTASSTIATTETPSRVLTDGTDTTFAYLSSSASGSVYSTATNGFINTTVLGDITTNKMVKVSDATAVTSTEPSTETNHSDEKAFVTTVPAGTASAAGKAYVGFSIWLEGESAHAVNAAAKETLGVTIHLTGF
jgi:hypothetical protein